ncbi:hypothetical protein HZP84_16035 [Elizabethkingia anophelis]|nr:hypothetical protein [Elizabethkingia anophelis]MCT3824974.1 hypothetical protein [Elizabethkingia anophelis]MCT3932279.1 hypothetical protein [Elizabethkingia anophelis]MCT4078345.1 hypothetical protein [Elizabethkingia anophelis]MCT4081639.1 hypothetical protein [Elizabethkingia anophelis]
MKKILLIFTALFSFCIITSCSSSDRDDNPEYVEIKSFDNYIQGRYTSSDGSNIVIDMPRNGRLTVEEKGQVKYSGASYRKGYDGKIYFKMNDRNEYSSIKVFDYESNPKNDLMKTIVIENLSSTTMKIDFYRVIYN